jgi:hypothetical protein
MSSLCKQDMLLALFTLAFGIGVVVLPEKIQGFGIRSHQRHPKLAQFNPFSDWITTPSCSIVIRLAGFLLVGMSLIVSYFAWTQCSR